MKKEPVIYLNHISDCIIKIQAYTDGINEDEFLNNSLIQDGVIRNLEIIGEATKLIDHYIKTLGAYHFGGHLMVIDSVAAQNLINRYFKS